MNLMFCSKCKLNLDPNLFGKNKLRSNGKQNWCKKCLSAYHKEYSRGVSSARFYHSKNKAKSRNMEFTILKDEYLNLISQPCHWCGFPLNATGVGLDRQDNTIGYIVSNVVPCCAECNQARSDYFTPNEMVLLGSTIKQIKAARSVI